MIKERLLNAFRNVSFNLKQAYDVCPEVNPESVRARIYENLGIAFQRIGKGIYIAQDCVLIEGDGRDLSFLENESIDAIITDHPWMDTKANKGGNRNFATYDCFQYTPEDFEEKARVMRDGGFLVEMLPAENESNYEYLYQIKKMAEAAGFQYYAKVPWVKGAFVANTGRKAKNSEDVMIFSKGKPRALKPDKQRGVVDGMPTRFMSGTNGMLPTDFNVQAVPKKQQISQSEKPVALVEQLLDFITKENELVLDQFAGSGVVGLACKNKNRQCILIEKDTEKVKRIAERIQATVVEVTATVSTALSDTQSALMNCHRTLVTLVVS